MNDSMQPLRIGFFAILALVFTVFKIIGPHFPTEVAGWSWWTVLMPVIIGYPLQIILLALAATLKALQEIKK